MRYLLIIGLAATLHAAIVTADHISIDVLAAPEPVWGVLPGQLLYRTPIVVNARLTNTGADTLFLNGIGGGSGFIPQSQIQPNTYIAGGASIEGPMFGKDLWSFTPVAWTDAEVIDGASESAYGIYSMGGGFVEYDWVVPPTWDPTRWTVPHIEVRRMYDVAPASVAPEPSTVALAALGIVAIGYRLLRQRSTSGRCPRPFRRCP